MYPQLLLPLLFLTLLSLGSHARHPHKPMSRRKRSWTVFENFFTTLPCRLKHHKAIVNENKEVVECAEECPHGYEEKYSSALGDHCKYIKIPTGCADRYFIRCNHGYLWMMGSKYSDRCVTSCPEGFYSGPHRRTCHKCTALNCAKCKSYSYNCVKCRTGYALLRTFAGLPSYCLRICPDGTERELLRGGKDQCVKIKTTFAPTTLASTTPQPTTLAPTTLRTTQATTIQIVTAPSLNCTHTVKGVPCSYPYRFKGKVYDGSCSAGHPRPWCAVETDAPGGRYTKWGFCQDGCVENDCPIQGCLSCVRSRTSTFHIGCAQCATGRVLHRQAFQDHCLLSCPAGYFPQMRAGTHVSVCNRCSSPFCSACSSPSRCTECYTPFILDPATGACGLCPHGSQFDFKKKQCVAKGVKLIGGYGFGLSTPSYIGFDVDRANFAQSTSFQIWLSTTHKNGLIMSAYGGPSEFERIYMRDGKIIYTWCTGAEVVSIESERIYNDGAWHMINTNRALQRGMLFVDNKVINQGMSGNMDNSTHVDNITRVYFGSLPHHSEAANQTPEQTQQFQGSVFDLKLYDLEMGSPVVENGVHQVYTNQEVKIGSRGGYPKKQL